MDFLAGICGKDFVLVCSDTRAVHSIVALKHDEDKTIAVDERHLLALSGEAGDRVNFSEYIIANLKLYALRNSRRLPTQQIAAFTRKELAVALRKSPYQCNMLIAGVDQPEERVFGGEKKEGKADAKKTEAKQAETKETEAEGVEPKETEAEGVEPEDAKLEEPSSPTSPLPSAAPFVPSLYYCDYLATLHRMNVAAFGYGGYFVLSLFDRFWRPGMSQDEALELMKKGVAEVRARLVVAPPKFLVKIIDAQGTRLVGEI